MTLTSASAWLAIIPSKVDFPTPEPAKIPIRCPRPHGSDVEPSLLEGNLLETGDLQTLPALDGMHEHAGFQEALVGARVQPGIAATEPLDTASVHVDRPNRYLP